MRVRAKKRAPEHKEAGGEPTVKQPAMPYSFPAPINGLSLDQNFGMPEQGTARVLENWTCTTKGIRVRGGTALHATLDGAGTSIFAYRSGVANKMFAATETSIFDVTTPADPAVTPAASVSGQTSGAYSTVQFATSGGVFLYAANGSDDAQLFDGTTWQAVNGTSSPISVTGVDTSGLSHVWSFANRVFFVEENTFDAWYLPVDSIGGAANSFSLAGVFRKGGALLFGATWSSDSGAGLDDRCVFVSTEGEAAVYQGSDPASDFSLVGVYELPRPISKNAHEPAGGDLLIATDEGLVPLSAAVQMDVAALPQRAVSKSIAPLWQDQARILSNEAWEITRLPKDNLLVVSQPTLSLMLVVNLQTGAWSTWTGIEATGLTRFVESSYAVSSGGLVLELNTGGNDNGLPYTARYLGTFEHAGMPGATKSIRQARATFLVVGSVNPALAFKTDFDLTASAAPASPIDYETAGWDGGLWGEAVWDDVAIPEFSEDWRSTPATGRYVAPELQMTFGVTPTPDVELVSIEATMHAGGLVT